MYKEPRIKLFKKLNVSVPSHISFYFEEDDHKAVDFNGETISFTCQLTKLKQKMILNMIQSKNETEGLLL